MGYVRLWRLLNALHAHLTERRTVTQRGLYYLLASRDPALFPNPQVVNACLQECVSLLRCSRHAMVGGRAEVIVSCVRAAVDPHDCLHPTASLYEHVRTTTLFCPVDSALEGVTTSSRGQVTAGPQCIHSIHTTRT